MLGGEGRVNNHLTHVLGGCMASIMGSPYCQVGGLYSATSPGGEDDNWLLGSWEYLGALTYVTCLGGTKTSNWNRPHKYSCLSKTGKKQVWNLSKNQAIYQISAHSFSLQKCEYVSTSSQKYMFDRTDLSPWKKQPIWELKSPSSLQPSNYHLVKHSLTFEPSSRPMGLDLTGRCNSVLTIGPSKMVTSMGVSVTVSGGECLLVSRDGGVGYMRVSSETAEMSRSWGRVSSGVWHGPNIKWEASLITDHPLLLIKDHSLFSTSIY